MREADPDGGLTRRSALLLFALVLVLRIATAAQFRGNFDSESFLIAADAAVQGENVYAKTSRYNYSPLWAYVVGALWAASEPNTSLFVLLLGLLQIGVDVGTSVLVLRIAERRLALSPGESRRAAILFFSNPVSVLVSCAHGQFDGTAILCLLGGIYWAMDRESEKKRGRVTWLLALSLLVKHVTAFHPFLFWRRVRRPGLSDGGIAMPYVVFFLSFLPFASAWQAIVRNVFLYSAGVEKGEAGRGGLQNYIGFSDVSPAFAVLLLLAVAWIVWITRRMPLPRASLVLFLALLVFVPSYAPQYLVWPLALGALHPSPPFALYTAAGALYLSAQNLALQLPIQVFPYGAWLAALLWLLVEIRNQGDPSFFDRPTASSA